LFYFNEFAQFGLCKNTEDADPEYTGQSFLSGVRMFAQVQKSTCQDRNEVRRNRSRAVSEPGAKNGGGVPVLY
jgi:hypothetical protein